MLIMKNIQFQIFSLKQESDDVRSIEGRFIQGDRLARGDIFHYLDEEQITGLEIVDIEIYGLKIEEIALGLTAKLILKGSISNDALINPRGKILSIKSEP